MKFILFVEGYSEAEDKRLAAYLKRWLDPKLRQPVGIAPVRFNGWAELVSDSPSKAATHLDGPHAKEIVGVIGLLDLYGPDIYPAEKQSASDRFRWIKDHLENEVNQPRFRQFCAVHEVEAWLLSQPDIFPRDVREAFPAKIAKPETVNFNEPPARLLGKLYRDKLKRTYKKRVDTPNLFDRADPAQGYAKCPYLKLMLDEMLAMAQKSGLGKKVS
jgi:hypothetical protein